MRRAKTARHLGSRYRTIFCTLRHPLRRRRAKLRTRAASSTGCCLQNKRERCMIRVAKKRTVLNALILGLSFLGISELRAQAPAATPLEKPTVNEAQAFVEHAEKQLFA